MTDVLTIHDSGSVITATLNRADKGNALNSELIGAIDRLCGEVEQHVAAGSHRSVVITGAGPKVFCAGADINELRNIEPEVAYAQMRRGQAVFDRLERLPVIVIAAINGFALGGGLELAMSADIRVAAPAAKLGQPEITLGNIPGWGGTQRLPQLVGRGIATELIMTGDLISAERALALGLVNALAEDPLTWAIETATRIASQNPVAVAQGKTAIRTGLEAGVGEGLVVEARGVAACCGTEFQREAVESFLNRRRRST